MSRADKCVRKRLKPIISASNAPLGYLSKYDVRVCGEKQQQNSMNGKQHIKYTHTHTRSC